MHKESSENKVFKLQLVKKEEKNYKPSTSKNGYNMRGSETARVKKKGHK